MDTGKLTRKAIQKFIGKKHEVFHGVSCYSSFEDRNSLSLFSRHSSSLKIFPQKMGFYKHEVGPSNGERQLLATIEYKVVDFSLSGHPQSTCKWPLNGGWSLHIGLS